MFIRGSKKRIACLEGENTKLRDLALKLTSQVRVLREALRDVPSENCRKQRPQVWERYLGSGQPIGLMQKMKHDAPGAAAAGPPPEWDRYDGQPGRPLGSKNKPKRRGGWPKGKPRKPRPRIDEYKDRLLERLVTVHGEPPLRPPSSEQDERFRLAMAAAGYIATTPSTKPGTKAPVSNYTGTD